ncbi:MAG: hypothetical protein O2822_00895 [Chloroflexi bacterium]|nr:hypothetical protein [Chloroflexota bacterium]
MARKQNYSYLKFQRDSSKAAKREAKKEQRAARGEDDPATDADAPEDLDAILDALVPGGRDDDESKS